MQSNRVGYSKILYTFKYTDAEIAGLVEGNLKIYTAESLAGGWLQRATTIDAARNTASTTITGSRYFALSTQGSQPNGWRTY